tara:strand:+ start:12676 stop:13965 length:1290 start_codon:yes stop_codon:yes gene_type:complete
MKNAEDNFEVWMPKSGRIVKAWTKGVPVEPEAKKQISDLTSLPFIYKYPCAMPDIHVGMGCTVGSVIPTQGAVVPSFVGVDLGCGMRAAKTNLFLEDIEGYQSLIFDSISRKVPHGRSDNGGNSDRGRWGHVPDRVNQVWDEHFAEGYGQITEEVTGIDRGNRVTKEHLGTLGTGNHFIEVCVEEGTDRIWFMLHSGSRGPGARIGNTFMKMAKEACQRWFIELQDPALSYFPQGVDEYGQYMKALNWAQQYAYWNRKLMMEDVQSAVEEVLKTPIRIDQDIDCHHNYAAMENHFGKNCLVTRKGAVRAREGDWVLIPGSMGSRSYVAMGKGNEASFTSCSHGAGRVMSRTKAKKNITLRQHEQDTEGVICYKDEAVLDESPRAYKSIDAVINAEKDLIEVRHTIKQIICIKGKEESKNEKRDKRNKKS